MAVEAEAVREAPGAQVLGEAEFRYIARLVAERTGIVLHEGKRELVYSRLSRRLRRLGLSSFAAYCRRLKGGDEEEISELINAITTNLTAFFREPHHFEYLAREALPALTAGRPAGTLRAWSAGCSTGEEPYSLAMVLAEALPPGWDWRILATDLDTEVLAQAEAGIYPMERIGPVSEARRRRFLVRGRGPRAGQVRVVEELRRRIVFRRLNLVEPWPVRGPFDLIFCRNVVIYFDKATQRRIFEGFAARQRPGAFLFIGHSETLYGVSRAYERVGNTVYRRCREERP